MYKAVLIAKFADTPLMMYRYDTGFRNENMTIMSFFWIGGFGSSGHYERTDTQLQDTAGINELVAPQCN